jgi:hypothetical protein
MLGIKQISPDAIGRKEVYRLRDLNLQGRSNGYLQYLVMQFLRSQSRLATDYSHPISINIILTV